MYNQTTELLEVNNDQAFSFVIPEVYRVIQTVNYAGISQAFGLMGVVTNFINMIVFIRIGFKDTINISLFVLSLSDFGTCVFGSVECLFANPSFREIDFNFDPIGTGYLLLSQPRIAFTKITTVVTACIAFERCLCVALPLKVKTIIVPGRVKALMVVIVIVVLGSSTPLFYYNRIVFTFYPHLNTSIYTLAFTEDKSKIERVFIPIYHCVYSIFAFILIVIFTAILVIKLQKKAVWRKTATTVTTSHSFSTKEKKIYKTAITISCLFIVCYLPEIVPTIYMITDPNFTTVGTHAHILLTVASFVQICEMLNSSVNLFIYYRNSSIYRSMFSKIFVFKCCKEQTTEHK